MKRFFLLLPFIFLMTGFGFGQSVTAPGSSTFLLNTANQDAGDFIVAGFGGSDNLLVSIGLINPPTGTSLRLSSTSGVTASTGYNLSNNFTRISFTGTLANVNAVLASLQVNTGVVAGAIQISVSATVNPPGYYYLPSTGHFYKPVTWPTGLSGYAEVYTTIKNSAAAETFKGQTGYLVTITSQDEQNFINANVPISNILIALTDKDVEGTWKWDAGPEGGTHIFTQTSGGSGGTIIGSHYNNWCGTTEPNNAGSGEDYTVTNWSGSNCWNDYGPPEFLFTSTGGSMGGWVVEFGTWTDPAQQNFSEFYSGSVVHQSYPPNPTGVSATSTAICNGSSTQLTATGAQGTVYWYTGSCGGTPTTPATGNPLTVSPTVTTTYYARNWEGGNFSTDCAQISITVESVPVSGILSKTPNVASICQGNSVSATLSAGSGGNGVDELEYHTNNGSDWSSWSAYTSGSSISTSGLAGIEIRTRRTASTCTSANYNTVSWSVDALQRFQTIASGNWTALANWEQHNGTSWVTATSYPGQISNSCSNPLVTIQTGHQMEIQSGSNINIPNLEIKATGKLTVKPGGKILVQNQLQLDENAGGAIIVEASTPPAFTCGTSQVTFTYNGSTATYGTVVGANNRCWLDRNLGATQVATSSTDAASYGDLFQWGRAADGHQVRVPLSGTTLVLSETDNPEHGNFIRTSDNNFNDWRSGHNHNLWQGVNGINNPCPSGYRLPTIAEWDTERLSWTGNNNLAGAFASPLKLPMPGIRHYSDGSLYYVGFNFSFYWSSTVPVGALVSAGLYFDSSTAYTTHDRRANGNPVRCIKD